MDAKNSRNSFRSNEWPFLMRDYYAFKKPETWYDSPEVDLPTCKVCQGRGVLKGTEDGDSWGIPCSEGCRLDIDEILRLRRQGQG